MGRGRLEEGTEAPDLGIRRPARPSSFWSVRSYFRDKWHTGQRIGFKTYVGTNLALKPETCGAGAVSGSTVNLSPRRRQSQPSKRSKAEQDLLKQYEHGTFTVREHEMGGKRLRVSWIQAWLFTLMTVYRPNTFPDPGNLGTALVGACPPEEGGPEDEGSEAAKPPELSGTGAACCPAAAWFGLRP